MKRILTIGMTILIAAALSLSFFNHASADSFNRNNIIDDGVFDNANSMSAAAINNWLNANFPNSCISPNRGFTAPDPTGYNPTNGYLYGGNVTAGQVIFDAGQAYGLNPQLILTKLQNEEGLVAGDGAYGCSALALSASMGYGCPDGGASYNYSGVNLYSIHGVEVTSVSGTCVNSAAKAGFSQQVIHAAWLLKFGEERSEGNIHWAVIRGNWDNSDDLSTCYGGPMTQGTFQRCPSGSSAYYDGYTTIDGTAVHMDDGATAALYWYTPHISSTVYNIFTSWFGTVRSTPFFTIQGNSSNVYITGGNNNFYHVTNPTELANYGYGTAFTSISTVTAAYANSLTNSGNLPPVANFDGGAEIYVWIGGGIHWFPDATTFSAYGYSFSSVADLPGWIQSKVAQGGNMTNVVKRQGSSLIYYIQNGKKSHISSNAAYTTLGSPVYSSLPTVTLAQSYIDSFPVGPPIMTAGTFAKASDTGSYGIWNGTSYQSINASAAQSTGISPDYTTSSSALSQLPANPSPLNKLAKDSSSNMYILDTGKKLSVTSGQLAALGLSSGSFVTTDDSFLSRFSTSAMQTLIRVNNSPAVYDIVSGKLYHIFSGTDFTGLGYSWGNVATVNQTTANVFTNANSAEFEQGRLVQINGDPKVYLIEGTFAKKYIPSAQIFTEYGFNWGSIVKVSAGDLSGYTTSGNLSEVVKDGSGVYWLVDSGVRHTMSTTMLSSSYYNITTASVPVLSDGALSRLPTSTDLTQYIKAPGNPAVYKVSNGQKQLYTSGSAFLGDGGNWSDIVQLSSAYINELPTGSPIN